MVLVLAAFVMFFLAIGQADAKIYRVKQGDCCLSKLAKRYQVNVEALYQANKDKIKHPKKWVFVGQRLQIPEKGKKASVVRSGVKKPFFWKRAAIKPFGNRSFTKAINSFNLPQEVKEIFIAQVKSGEFKKGQLQFGQRLDQMIFDNYQVVGDIIVQVQKKFRHIKIYPPVRFGNKIYHLVNPLVCNNWAWWSETVPVPEPEPPAPEPEPEPEKPAPVCPDCPACPVCPDCPQPQPQPAPEPLAPAPKPEEPVEAPVAPPEREIERQIPPPEVEALVLEQPVVGKKLWGPDASVAVGVFADEHRSHNNPHGLWGVGNFYPLNFEDGHKLHSLGAATEGNYWRGITGDHFHYFGDRYAADLAYRLLTPRIELQARAGLGQINDWGHIRTVNPAGRFKTSQQSDIITTYAGYEYKRNGQTRLFNRTRFFVQADFDIDRRGRFSWTDARGIRRSVSGHVGNKSSYNFGVDGSVYKLTENVSLAVGASVTHYHEDSKTGFRLSPGLDFYASGMVIAGVRINPTYWSDKDHAVGVGAFLDVTNLFKHLFPNLMPGRTFKDKKWEQKELDQNKQEQMIQDILKGGEK